MGLMHVTFALRVPGSTERKYESLFLVDTGAIDCMAPASALAGAGIQPVGRSTFELADGTAREYAFGLGQIEFVGEVTAGRETAASSPLEVARLSATSRCTTSTSLYATVR
jgi:hypothetical protein